MPLWQPAIAIQIAQSSPGRSKSRVRVNGFLKIDERLSKSCSSITVQEISCPEVGILSGWIDDRGVSSTFLFLGRQRDLHLAGDGLGDPTDQTGHVAQIAIVALRPDMLIG